MKEKTKNEEQPRSKDLSIFDIDKIKPYLKKIFKKRSYIVITIITVFLLAGGTVVGAFYYKDSNLIKKAEQLIKEAKYEDAIGALSNFPKYSLLSQKAQIKIEESKRKIVERELSEEKVARGEAEAETQKESLKRSQAEAEAQQERFEKELKTKQLSDKEAEEKMMNADNDGDGLSYKRELELGSSDWNTDSDSDGIPDGQDMHPAGGGVNQVQTFAWSYGGHNWNWTESIPEDWYYYYKEKPRSSPESTIYITSGDPFIKKISNSISEGAEQYSLGKAWLAVAFVQSLPYVDDVYTGYDERPKYPVETFFEKNGDCEDTSYLTASILDAMNIGSVLILLPGHMAVGVYMDCNTAGTYYILDDRCYYYVETTGEDWPAGEIPDEYRYTNVTLVKIPSGEKIANIAPKYVKPCDPSLDFPGYYFDGNNFYSDSQCNNLVYCLSYKNYYFDIQDKNFYWDSGCSQIVVKGCAKATGYSGYFTNGVDYYYDSRCSQKARVCRFSSVYYDRYWDGYDFYWDSSCSKKVVPGCYKSTVYPGYFFNSVSWYSDYQCTQEAKPY